MSKTRISNIDLKKQRSYLETKEKFRQATEGITKDFAEILKKRRSKIQDDWLYQILSPSLRPKESPISELDELLNKVSETQNAIRMRVQDILKEFAEKNISDNWSLKDKESFARSIQRLLNISESRILCPKCGEQATFRAALKRGKTGIFQFVHVQPRRTVHGGSSTLPANLRIVPQKDNHPPKG